MSFNPELIITLIAALAALGFAGYLATKLMQIQVKSKKMEEISSAINYLVSDPAAYITGQTININGGYFM